jgi:phosphoglycerate dehydrogenase-like enzyme
MRSSAYLINTSRAPIVNENDLVQALKDKRIAGAGLDVFDVEPLPMDHSFRALPNVLATPHIGYVTQENYKIYFEHAIENIIAFLNNNPVRTLK